MSSVAPSLSAVRSPGTIVLAAAVSAAVIAGAIFYNPVYGGAAVAGLALVLLLVLAPKLAFYGLMLALTAWPYYVGIPLGRDLPIPVVLPVIGLTYVVVLIRQALRIEPPPPPDRYRNALQGAILVLALTLTLSVAVSGSPSAGFKSLPRVMLAPLVLFLIARHFIRDAVTARRVLDLLLIGTAIGGSFAMYEWVLKRNPLIETFAPPIGDLADHVYWTVVAPGLIPTLYRSHGFGMNPIFFGGALAMLLTHAAIRFARAETSRTRLLVMLAGTLSLGGLVSTFSRGPLLAAVLGLSLVAIAYPAIRKYYLAAFGIVSVYLAADLLRDTSALAERLNDSDNVTLRLKLWQTAWNMFLDHPIFGVGLGQFQDHQLRIVRDHQIGPFFEFGDGRLEMVKTAEHGVLQLLAETGIVGGFAGALLVGCVLWRLGSALFKRGPEPGRSVTLAAALGFLIALMVGFTVTIYNSWEVCSIIPVMLAILCVAERPGGGGHPVPEAEPSGRPRAGAVRS